VFSLSKRLRVEASECVERAQGQPSIRWQPELWVGLDRQTMRALGVEVGQTLLLYSNGAPAVSAGDMRRAAPPGAAFGFAVELSHNQLPAAHVRLPPTLRLQLGCEAGVLLRQPSVQSGSVLMCLGHLAQVLVCVFGQSAT
jgi:hypothetical protein